MLFRFVLVSYVLAAIFSQSESTFAASSTSSAVKTKPAGEKKSSQIARARQPGSCSQFGPGFERMAGSDTCISINGAIDAGLATGR